METKNPVSPAIVMVAIVLLLEFIGTVAYRSLAPSNSASGQAGGAKTVAPAVQRYPDGTVVPYPAAPTGATPGDPFSVRRTARICIRCRRLSRSITDCSAVSALQA